MAKRTQPNPDDNSQPTPAAELAAPVEAKSEAELRAEYDAQLAAVEQQKAELAVENRRLAAQVADLSRELDATRDVATEQMRLADQRGTELERALGPEDEMKAPCICYAFTLGATDWKAPGAVEERLCETDADLEKLLKESAQIGRTWHTSPKHCRPWTGASATE